MTGSGIWIIDRQSADEAKADVTDPMAMKKWDKYEADVTENPFSHPKRKRIGKLKSPSFPNGTYRYRNDPLRVIYYPEKETKMIVTLEASGPTDASYKIKSKSGKSSRKGKQQKIDNSVKMLKKKTSS